MSGTWDCVHPCVHICVMVNFGLVQMSESMKETLDAYGYLDESGKPDMDKVNRELTVKTNNGDS